MKFTDTISWKSDSLELVFGDPDGRFRKVFTWQKGNTLDVSIQQTFAGGQVLQRDYGTFEVHKIQGRRKTQQGCVITVHCNSCPSNSPARLSGMSQGYAATTLKTLAGQIATNCGMTLNYQAPKDYPVARSDQKNESYMVILARLCQSNGLDVKIKAGQLIIFDRIAYEAQPAIGTISAETGLNNGGVIDWAFDTDSEETYAQAQMTHFDPKTGRLTKGNFTDPNNPPVNRTLLLTEKPYRPTNTDLPGQ
jgi:phage protein D